MRITPAEMADLYWMHLRKRALGAVMEILKQYEHAPETLRYWQTVASYLRGDH